MSTTAEPAVSSTVGGRQSSLNRHGPGPLGLAWQYTQCRLARQPLFRGLLFPAADTLRSPAAFSARGEFRAVVPAHAKPSVHGAGVRECPSVRRSDAWTSGRSSQQMTLFLHLAYGLGT